VVGNLVYYYSRGIYGLSVSRRRRCRCRCTTATATAHDPGRPFLRHAGSTPLKLPVWCGVVWNCSVSCVWPATWQARDVYPPGFFSLRSGIKNRSKNYQTELTKPLLTVYHSVCTVPHLVFISHTNRSYHSKKP
jgi:hypothetical protein